MKKKLLVAAFLATSIAVSSGGSAQAANGNASCLGLSLSDHGPAGEMPEQVADTKMHGDEIGTSFGTLVSGFAHLHLGSHAACEGAA